MKLTPSVEARGIAAKWADLRGYLHGSIFGKGDSPSTITALDGIRAVAVLFIFVRHSWGVNGAPPLVIPVGSASIDLSPLMVMTSNGVDLFFVLSGFLLARRFIEADMQGRPQPSLGRYFRTRWFRIAPAYYFVLFAFLIFFVPSVLASSSVYSWAGLKTLLAHLTFMQTALPFSFGYWAPQSPFWTLTIEVMFYVTVPWWARLFFRNRWTWALPLALAVSVGWLAFARFGVPTPIIDLIVRVSDRPGATPEFAEFYLSRQFPGFAFSFACGMTAANWYCQHRAGYNTRIVRALRSATGSWLALVGAMSILLVGMVGLGTLTLRHRYYDGLALMASDIRSSYVFYFFEAPLMAAPFALIIAVVTIRGGSISKVLSVTPLRTVGILGYSIYLWHMPFLYQHAQLPWAARFDGIERAIVMLLFSTVIVGIVSFFTYSFVERPGIARGQRLATRSALGPKSISDTLLKADHDSSLPVTPGYSRERAK